MNDAPARDAEVTIEAGFPGGNILVEKLDGDTVYLQPDLRDTEGPWFYWCFRVRGAAGRVLRFVFTRHDPVGVRGAAVSVDEGETWRWLGAEQATVASFVYAFGRAERSVRFSFGMPYTQSHWDRFVAATAPAGSAVRQDVLCRSRKGRPVECLRVGPPQGAAPRGRVLLVARHHACEAMADYALEGAVEAVLAADEAGAWFGSNAEVAVVPFVDKDGVEDGDQGKNRRPHDHNRDYIPAGIYPEVRAICELVARWAAASPVVMVDLHCPWIRGGHNETVFQVGGADAAQWTEQQRFARLLERCRRGPLPYRASDDLPYGEEWNVDSSHGMQQCFARWGASVPGVRLATSFELPYANARDVEVNADTARAFGRDLAAAIRLYLAQ